MNTLKCTWRSLVPEFIGHQANSFPLLIVVLTDIGDIISYQHGLSMLQHFLDIKKHRKENTIEVTLLPLIINLVSENGIELSASSIWHKITTGGVDGHCL